MNYSEKITLKKEQLLFDEESQTNKITKPDTTRETFTTENGDKDYIWFMDHTRITETLENNDEDFISLFQPTLVTNIVENDEINENSTMITRSLESTDSDELFIPNLGITWVTESIEPSDDEIYLI